MCVHLRAHHQVALVRLEEVAAEVVVAVEAVGVVVAVALVGRLPRRHGLGAVKASPCSSLTQSAPSTHRWAVAGPCKCLVTAGWRTLT